MRILSFSLSNYRSFRSEQKIIFGSDEKNITAIYGPNGAGKSNLFYALDFFCNFIRTSTKYEGQKLPYESFLLNAGAMDLPTTFEAEFVAKKRQFKYRFSLLNGTIVEESLGMKKIGPGGKYDTVFSRPTIPKGNYGEFYRSVLRRTRDDALVLTKAWEDNDKIAVEVFEWLSEFKIMNMNQLPISRSKTAEKIMTDESFKIRVLDLMRRADLHVRDIIVDQITLNNEMSEKASSARFVVYTTHLLRNDNGDVVGTIPMSMTGHESVGTQRIFELAFPILNAIDNGGILYFDEFENDLHPNECKFLVSLFEKENLNRAQLIINTHSTILQDQVGRDNIRLLSKNTNEETIISEVPKTVKPGDPAIERKYNKGILGAVPVIRE